MAHLSLNIDKRLSTNKMDVYINGSGKKPKVLCDFSSTSWYYLSHTKPFCSRTEFNV